MTEGTDTPAKWNFGKVVATVIAGLVLMWLASQFTESLDQARTVVGIERGDGKSIEEYNEEQRRNKVFDDVNGCPPLDRCGGSDPSGGYNDVAVYPEF
jgi:hypothetical protein